MDIKSGNEWVFPLLKKNFKKYFWNLRGFFSKSAFSFRHYLNKSPISQEIKYESPYRLPRGIMPLILVFVWVSVTVITFFVPL